MLDTLRIVWLNRCGGTFVQQKAEEGILMLETSSYPTTKKIPLQGGAKGRHAIDTFASSLHKRVEEQIGVFINKDALQGKISAEVRMPRENHFVICFTQQRMQQIGDTKKYDLIQVPLGEQEKAGIRHFMRRSFRKWFALNVFKGLGKMGLCHEGSVGSKKDTWTIWVEAPK